MSTTRRKVAEKITRKDKEIQGVIEERQKLDTKLMTLRAEKKGMEDILKMLPEDGKDEQCRTIRPTSQTGKAQKFLKKTGKPAYIGDILVGIKKANNTKNRGSLAGSLRTYVRRGEVFTLVGPNTFGLLEWGNSSTAQEEPDQDERSGVIPLNVTH